MFWPFDLSMLWPLYPNNTILIFFETPVNPYMRPPYYSALKSNTVNLAKEKYLHNFTKYPSNKGLTRKNLCLEKNCIKPPILTIFKSFLVSQSIKWRQIGHREYLHIFTNYHPYIELNIKQWMIPEMSFVL